MFNFNDPQTMWLTITNLALGLVTVICVVAVAVPLVKKGFATVRQRATETILADDHAFVVPGLGITMADGGEKIDESTLYRKNDQSDEDNPNIIRSEN
jgi:hypothetical protein